eukprot:2277857-Prymnesium_polylepis.1
MTENPVCNRLAPLRRSGRRGCALFGLSWRCSVGDHRASAFGGRFMAPGSEQRSTVIQRSRDTRLTGDGTR